MSTVIDGAMWNTGVVSESTLTCPDCGHRSKIEMPRNECMIVYDCTNCSRTMRPVDGDCCVFCSHGSHACLPVQMSRESVFQKGMRLALILSLITIVYNVVEGVVSTFFGASDETLALFGFGVDSFVEVLSGIGIAHMIWRMHGSEVTQRDGFEVTALRITGIAFYLLVAGLIVGSGLSILFQAQPQTTMVGIVISIISIVTMYFLYTAKVKVGRKLASEPILADANCTKTCFYLSFILLISSLSYTLWQIPYIDAAGGLGIAWFALKEGKESFEKARTKRLACEDDCC